MGIRIEGMKELEKTLREMATSTARRTVKRAMETALEPVASAAKAMAPKSDGSGKHMADGIAVGSKLTKRQAKEAKSGAVAQRHIVQMYVGPRASHSHLIEFGTGPRHQKNGRFVGSMPPSPFMRPAWDANREAVLASLTEAVRAEIAKTLARAAKAAAKRAAKG